MIYTWKDKDFERYINMLPNLIENETDVKKRCYLLKVYDVSKQMMLDRFSSMHEYPETVRQRMFTINNERIFYGRYYTLIQEFYDKVTPLLDKMHSVEDKITDLFGEDCDIAQVTGSYLSNGKALSLTAAFYECFDKEIKPCFDEVFEDRFNFLRFLKTPSSAGRRESDGTTLFIDGVRKNFITIKKSKEADKVYTMIHEYGHATKNLYNPSSSYSSDDGLFVEVDGIFPELVAMHENIGNINPLYVAFNKYATLVNYLEYADYLTLQTALINCWKENGRKNNATFRKQVEDYYNVDKDMLRDIVNSSIFDEGVYVMSYLVAIELLHIYKKDKEQAINLYNQFLSLTSESDLFPYVCSLVRINGNVLEEAETVVDEMKLELERYEAEHV